MPTHAVANNSYFCPLIHESQKCDDNGAANSSAMAMVL
jgi:hypothetical protein